ncbi:zinc ribbon domain-containing protein [Dysgonomonas termitidis]|uniref:Zinc ribbon domain-containing protein n=1 Tax=Dysgonomonas termitidis TaxID=1516126 RepID=A0ABV9L4F7_9BACT
MFCKNCSFKNDKDARFCENCGAGIEKSPIETNKALKRLIKCYLILFYVLTLFALYFAIASVSEPKAKEEYSASVTQHDESYNNSLKIYENENSSLADISNSLSTISIFGFLFIIVAVIVLYKLKIVHLPLAINSILISLYAFIVLVPIMNNVEISSLIICACITLLSAIFTALIFKYVPNNVGVDRPSPTDSDWKKSNRKLGESLMKKMHNSKK